MKPSATGLIANRAQELREAGVHVHDFSAGDLDLPNHPLIIDAAKKAVGLSPYAPTAGLSELRDATALWMNDRTQSNFKRENVVVTSGGKFAIYAALIMLLTEDDEVIIQAPYWTSYPEMVKLALAKPVIVQTRWKLTPDELKKNITKKTRVLILNNACNPTGVLYTEAELEELLEVAKEHNLFVISDEVYSEIVFDGAKFVSLASFKEHKNHVLIIESCSKNFAMAGWRVGFAIGPEKLIEKIIALQSQTTSGASIISQKVALVAIQNSKEVSRYVRDAIQERRKAFQEAFEKEVGKKIHLAPSGMYHFIKMDHAKELLETVHVAVVPGEAFGSPGYVRFSLRDTEEAIREGLKSAGLFLKGFSSI